MRLTKVWLESHRAELPAMNAAFDIAGNEGISDAERIWRILAHPYYNHFKESCILGLRMEERMRQEPMEEH